MLFTATCATAQVTSPGNPSPSTASLPAGTIVRVVLLAQIASNSAKTGDAFQFQTVDDVVVGGNVVLKKGSAGKGTVKLAAPASSFGQEGDLTLDFDTVAATGGSIVAVNSELEAQGKNAKGIASIFSGGGTSGFGSAIHGADIGIPTNQVIELVQGAKARFGSAPTPAPSPAAVEGNSVKLGR